MAPARSLRSALGHRHWATALGLVAAAAALSGCGTSGSASSTTTTAPSPPARRAGLTVKQRGVTVRISWSAPHGGGSIHYRLSRGGRLIDELTKTSFSDDTIDPGHRYLYSVVAVRGLLSSKAAALSVKTHRLPLAETRLDDLYTVSAHPIHTSGLTGVHNVTYGWEFKARCKSGPCSGRWSDLSSHDHAAFTRSGASDTFTFTGPLNVQCSGHQTTSTLTAHFRVTEGESETGKWKAAKFTGTLDIETPSQLGCLGTSEVDRIYGALQ